jgi:Uma2 family endonuclease
MAAAPAPAPPMTAEELMELPDDGSTFYELSRGIHICMNSSAYQPSRIADTVLVRLGAFVDQHDLGEYGAAGGGFKLASNPETVRTPDVWFVRADRAPAEDLGFYDYLDTGTPLIRVLDPRSRLVVVFRPGTPVRFIDADGVLDGEGVLPGFSLPLRDVLR